MPSTAGKVNWTKSGLFRLTFAESKLWTRRIDEHLTYAWRHSADVECGRWTSLNVDDGSVEWLQCCQSAAAVRVQAVSHLLQARHACLHRLPVLRYLTCSKWHAPRVTWRSAVRWQPTYTVTFSRSQFSPSKPECMQVIATELSTAFPTEGTKRPFRALSVIAAACRWLQWLASMTSY